MKLSTTLAALALSATTASAASLVGDTVDYSLTFDGSGQTFASSGVVREDDGVISTPPHFDFGLAGAVGIFANLNEGADGLGFRLFHLQPTNLQIMGFSSITFSDLDFTDGAELTGFTITESRLPIFEPSSSFTGNSLTLNWTDQNAGNNPLPADTTLIAGTFQTSEATAEVPLPAPALMLLSALGLLALRRRA